MNANPVTRPSLTTLGRVAAGTGLLLLFLGLLSGWPALLFAGMCALFFPLAALPLCAANLRGLDVSRHTPEFVFRGRGFSVRYELSNRKRWLCSFAVTLDDGLLDSDDIDASTVGAVLPGRRVEFWRHAKVTTRGALADAPLRVHSCFPLGLASVEVRVGPRDRLHVCPAPFVPARLRELEQSGSGYGGVRAARAESIGEFRSLREFVPGDSPRLVSWPVSSRTGTLIVREAERPAPREVAVIFHSYQPPNTVLAGWTFERALELATGLCLQLHAMFVPFTFCGGFNDRQRIGVSAATGLHELLTAMAKAAPSPCRDLAPLAELMRAEAERAHAIVVMSNAPRRLWARQLPALRVPVVMIDHAGASAPLARTCMPDL
jgi:uncharacterized protein (DUF58 family)